VHGIHIHAAGTCAAPGFLSAGGHFNPGGLKHGFLNPEGAHAGDLPNMIVPASGASRYEAADYRITLGSGPNSLFGPNGTSLVIHAGPDDYSTDPAGNSGARVICGQILKR
jgi:Cu-Zn family superoxide dismutase